MQQIVARIAKKCFFKVIAFLISFVIINPTCLNLHSDAVVIGEEVSGILVEMSACNGDISKALACNGNVAGIIGCCCHIPD